MSQVVNFIIFEGSTIIFEKFQGSNYKFDKFEGSICNFLKNYWGQIENFEDQNVKFEKL